MKLLKVPDSMTIILSFNNKNLSIIVKRFKQLEYIKEKAYQLFYPIKSDILLKYNNKDLSSFLDQSIGLIFENKGKVKLEIEQIIGTKRPLIKKIKLNSQKNIFNNMNNILELNIPNIQDPPDITDRYKSIQAESLPTINLKTLNNSSSIKKKLPPIKNKNNKIKIKIDILSYKLCRECLTNETKYYCRQCNKFICIKCNNKKHTNHLLLESDINNEKRNVDIYKEAIINKLCLVINNLDNIDNIQTNEISMEEWKNKYNEAINNLTQIAQEQKEELKNNKNSNKKNNSNDNDNNNKNEFLKRLKDEKELLNNIVISTGKDPFELFNDINKRERIINQTIKKGRNKMNKIEEMFINIENEIDNVLFELEETINVK